MEAGCVVAAVIENAASGDQGGTGSGDVLQGDVAPCSDQDKSEDLSQAANSNPSEEKQAQEAPGALAPTDDITEHPAEPLLRSCVSTASMKVKNMKKLTFTKGHFPRLEECAHFHYETVDFGSVQLFLKDDQNEGPKANLDSKELVFFVQITCQGKLWLVKRAYEDFRVLDKHLHLCIYDRRFSQLTELPKFDPHKESVEVITKMLATYLSRFSAIADNKINCGPVLTWMEIDNKGNHLLVSEEASINVPAIAAAHVTKRYTAQATDELTFEVGDIVSVIDMPPKEDTGWWRGKHGFQVGFFPCDCVELINDKIPPSVQTSFPKPVCKKHGKLVTFLRSFMKSRPPPQKLRQRGILRERVFGCDLGEHLHNSGHDAVPQVVQSCAEFIEKHGVVDGIYRLSGISSNIQKLRHEFDSEQIPDLTRDNFRQDIHSVGSLCKLYFRELPNPLLTYQLYDRFAEAVSAATDEERLVKIYNVIQQLPPPHYRTLEFLMRHLSRLATFSTVTNMHTKNLAIVWAPNLLRSKQIESACFSGTAAFMEVRIQSVVVEFILNNTEALFSQKINAIIRENNGNNSVSRPKSLLVCSPSTKLLSLEEAQARTQAQLGSPATTPCLSHSTDYIEVGEGPEALLGKFHTVIDLPIDNLKRAPVKSKKSPVGNWLSFFHLGKSHSVSKRKLKRHPSEPNEMKSIALPGGRGDTGTLRSTKSEESLTSLHNIEVDPHSYRPLRPRSTSEAISAAVSKDDLHSSRSREEVRPHSLHTPSIPSPQDDDLDLSPPAVGISTLDFDPMSFQCGKSGYKWRKSAGCSSESDPISSPNNNLDEFSPDISPGLEIDTKKVSKSPKLRKKSFKTQADVQNASTAYGSSTSPSPCTPSPLDDRCDAADGKERRPPYPHCSPISTVSQASDLPDPGTDRLMSSVSVLPPHPPLMSAARKLALALAESAQRASGAPPQRRYTYTPPHPLLPSRQDAPPPPPGQDRPARPSMLDLKVYLQEQHRAAQPSTGHSPAKSHRYPHFRPGLLQDGQESFSNFTPNVSPLGSGSLDEGRDDSRLEDTPIEPTYQSVGVSTPTQPVCPTQSPLTSPVYVNTDSINVFNFRAVLAETSMPTSIEQVLPRPLHRHYSAEEDSPDDYGYLIPTRHLPRCPPPDSLPVHLQKSIYRQSSEGHYSALAPRYPLSPQNRHRYKDEHVLSGFQRSNSQQQRSDTRDVAHPAIRRARSFHAPQISHYELAEAEIMPPDTLFYMDQDAFYSRLLETGRLPASPLESDPRYQCYQGDNTQYYAEPCQPSGIRHSQSYTLHSTRESGQSDYYAQPVNRELFIERDTVVYEARDAEVYERVVYQPYSRGKCKITESPYDSPGSRNRDIMHTRSKSDPGNAYLLCADRQENIPATSPTSPLSQQSEPEVKHQISYRPGVEPGQPRRIHIKDSSSQQLHKVPSLPERACPPNLKNIEHKSHVQGYEQASGYSGGALKPGILRRPGRSQSTREHRPHQYQLKSPVESEHPGSFSQSGRRTQSYKVRPTQHDFAEGYYGGPRSKPARSNKAVSGFAQGQSCMSPNRHRLLSKALGREGFYQAALRSEGGVYD